MNPFNPVHLKETEEIENSRNTGGLENSNHVKKRRHSDGGGFSKSIFKSNIFVTEKTQATDWW